MSRGLAKAASGVGLCAVIGFAAAFYLAFAFPRTMQVWAAQEQRLTLAEQVIVNVSTFSRQFGLVLLPVQFIAAVGCFTLATMAMRNARKGRPAAGREAPPPHASR